jgi:glycosyltransferase involved in cell wall biosynthesis
MKTLLLIPSVMKTGLEEAISEDRHPVMDYGALAKALRAEADGYVDLLDYSALESDRRPLLRLVRKAAGRDAALALMGFLRRRQYEAIFTNGENVGIPLALLFKAARRRPHHVTIGHRLSTGKKRLFFKNLRVDRQIDTIFVYAETQRDYAEKALGIPSKKLSLIAFHADQHFYRPMPNIEVDPDQICSAGLEWRDYPTLIAAVADVPHLKVKLAAASPWSKHTDETASRVLPPNVDARRYEYSALRDLYAGSNFVVVPLYENDFQAGVTTLLEAMAMGKAVIVTRTTGQKDVVTEEENGLTVAPGDVSALRQAIIRLQTDEALRERLGRNAWQWVQENATLSQWVGQMVAALHRSSSCLERSTDPSSSVAQKVPGR